MIQKISSILYAATGLLIIILTLTLWIRSGTSLSKVLRSNATSIALYRDINRSCYETAIKLPELFNQAEKSVQSYKNVVEKTKPMIANSFDSLEKTSAVTQKYGDDIKTLGDKIVLISKVKFLKLYPFKVLEGIGTRMLETGERFLEIAKVMENFAELKSSVKESQENTIKALTKTAESLRDINNGPLKDLPGQIKKTEKTIDNFTTSLKVLSSSIDLFFLIILFIGASCFFGGISMFSATYNKNLKPPLPNAKGE